jgi:dihydrofolate reductase
MITEGKMRKLIVFNHISLDGYFVDAHGSMARAKMDNNDPEYNAFVAENASGDGTLLFGRVTYELMIKYWPTPMAKQHDPAVAEGMNNMPKFVFSRMMDKASWNNTTVVKGDPVAEVRKMKEQAGNGMAILGSGTIVSQLAAAGLIDEYQVVVNPIILGKGRTMFESVKNMINLKLTKTRSFKSGKVYVCYEPAV